MWMVQSIKSAIIGKLVWREFDVDATVCNLHLATLHGIQGLTMAQVFVCWPAPTLHQVNLVNLQELLLGLDGPTCHCGKRGRDPMCMDWYQVSCHGQS